MNAREKLRDILASCDGMVTRAWLDQQIDALKKRPLPTKNPDRVVDDEHAATTAPGVNGLKDPATDESTKISVLLLTPRANDINGLKREDVTEGEPACFRRGRAVADDAVMIIAARVNELTSMATLLHWWRFERFSHIYLIASPEGPDITRAKALAVCQRGSLKVTYPITAWLGREDPLLLADVLTQGIAGRRVHLFASEETVGWEAIVGDDNWRVGEPRS
jgi:hypothetical protein